MSALRRRPHHDPENFFPESPDQPIPRDDQLANAMNDMRAQNQREQRYPPVYFMHRSNAVLRNGRPVAQEDLDRDILEMNQRREHAAQAHMSSQPVEAEREFHIRHPAQREGWRESGEQVEQWHEASTGIERKMVRSKEPGLGQKSSALEAPRPEGVSIQDEWAEAVAGLAKERKPGIHFEQNMAVRPSPAVAAVDKIKPAVPVEQNGAPPDAKSGATIVRPVEEPAEMHKPDAAIVGLRDEDEGKNAGADAELAADGDDESVDLPALGDALRQIRANNRKLIREYNEAFPDNPLRLGKGELGKSAFPEQVQKVRASEDAVKQLRAEMLEVRDLNRLTAMSEKGKSPVHQNMQRPKAGSSRQAIHEIQGGVEDVQPVRPSATSSGYSAQLEAVEAALKDLGRRPGSKEAHATYVASLRAFEEFWSRSTGKNPVLKGAGSCADEIFGQQSAEEAPKLSESEERRAKNVRSLQMFRERVWGFQAEGEVAAASWSRNYGESSVSSGDGPDVEGIPRKPRRKRKNRNVPGDGPAVEQIVRKQNDLPAEDTPTMRRSEQVPATDVDCLHDWRERVFGVEHENCVKGKAAAKLQKKNAPSQLPSEASSGGIYHNGGHGHEKVVLEMGGRVESAPPFESLGSVGKAPARMDRRRKNMSIAGLGKKIARGITKLMRHGPSELKMGSIEYTGVKKSPAVAAAQLVHASSDSHEQPSYERVSFAASEPETSSSSSPPEHEVYQVPETAPDRQDYFLKAAELRHGRAAFVLQDYAKTRAWEAQKEEEMQWLAAFEEAAALEAHQVTLVTECICCKDTKNTEEHFSPHPPTYSCEHKSQTCRECLQRWLASELQAKGCRNLHCPECLKIMEFEDVQRGASVETRDAYERFMLLAALSDEPEFAWCLAPNCNFGQLHINGDVDNFMECAECQYQQCLQHKGPWHADETCEAYDKRVNFVDASEVATQAMIDSVSKICPGPGCGWRIQKTKGCDHMHCSRCGHQFCWRCLADFHKIKTEGNTAHATDCKFHSHNLDLAWPFNAHA